MSPKWWRFPTDRRSFLARLGAGASIAGASMIGSKAAVARVAGDAPWRPALHAQDDWLETIPGEHRFVFDTTTPDGMALAFQFTGNYFTANADPARQTHIKNHKVANVPTTPARVCSEKSCCSCVGSRSFRSDKLQVPSP